jgi:acyl carrier protein
MTSALPEKSGLAVRREIPPGRAGWQEITSLPPFPPRRKPGPSQARFFASTAVRISECIARSVHHPCPEAGIIFIKEECYMTLEEKVISIITEQLDVTREECVPAASFIDDLGADSLDLVELIMEMEETFDIQIADNELEKIRTIKDVLDYLKNRNVVWHE